MLQVAFCVSQLLLITLQAIFNEQQIYKCNRGHLGMRREVWYDVTDYECWKNPAARRSRSPLELLSFLTYEDLEKPSARKFFASPVFATWMYIKFRMNLFPLVVWFLLRVLITFSIYFFNPVLFPKRVEEIGVNATIPCTVIANSGLPVTIALVTYASLVLILDVTELIWYLQNNHVALKVFLSLKDYASQHVFFR